MARFALSLTRHALRSFCRGRIAVPCPPGKRLGFTALAMLCCCATACDTQSRPSVEITKVPPAAEGGPVRFDTIEGYVFGNEPGQRIVIYARYGPWWVQPLTEQPFTEINSDLTWKNTTHLGTEYAALLVDSSYHPAPILGSIPPIGGGVAAIAVRRGEPHFWQTWWFLCASIALGLLLVSAYVRLWLLGVERQMSVRYEERLAERARIARELHDSLLQGLQGLMLRLQAVRNLLPDHPREAMQDLDVALDRGDEVIAEGRRTVEDLRNATIADNDIVQALTALCQELANDNAHHPSAASRVLVEGKPRDLDPILRDEIYRIAREALRNAFHHSGAHKIEAEVDYGDSQFSLVVRDDGNGIDPKVFDHGGRRGHWGLPGMRERAKEFGGHLKVWSESGAGTEVQLTIPASVAYAASPARRKLASLGAGIRGIHDHQS
jgi:signal transduction histidine kinase